MTWMLAAIVINAGVVGLAFALGKSSQRRDDAFRQRLGLKVQS